MGTVAVLGTGLLGSGFVQSLLRQGLSVRVYNRTRDKAVALQSLGAEVAEDPAAAVRGVDRVHVVLSDDAAIDAVLDAAGADLKGPVIDHTTASPAGVVARVQRLAARGVTYVHAPVFMGPANARDATGIMLVCGAAAAVDPLIGVLEPMTGRVLRLGERVDLAAAMKLFGNSVLISQVAAAADMVALARALDVPAAQAVGLFEQFDPSASFKMRAKRIAEGVYGPASFELSMARKDVRLMIEAAGDEPLVALPGIARRMDELLAEGHGQDDLAALGRPRRT